MVLGKEGRRGGVWVCVVCVCVCVEGVEEGWGCWFVSTTTTNEWRKEGDIVASIRDAIVVGWK